MSKESIHVKSNGIRNELKEIRKSIDALTKVMAVAISSNKQTYENNYYRSGHRNDDQLSNPSDIL